MCGFIFLNVSKFPECLTFSLFYQLFLFLFSSLKTKLASSPPSDNHIKYTFSSCLKLFKQSTGSAEREMRSGFNNDRL